MLIAIDPDVIVASLTDSNCRHMLYEVFEHLDRLRVAVDDSQKIVDEYYEFLDQYIDTDQEHVAIRLLQKMLLDRQDIMLYLPTRLLPSLQDAVEKHKCTTPVEPELIGIVANAKNLGLKLLLAGRGINARLRDRKLNDPQVRRALLKEIPWLEVHFASDRKQLFAPPLTIHYNARIFELLVARAFQTEHPNLRCLETPEGVKNQLKKQEDVDLYGYEQNGDTLFVWVGECKLREEGKEKSKPITTKEMTQLSKRIDAARQYESNRPDLADKNVQIRGLIISNAEDFFDDTTRQEAKKLAIELWHVKLTSGWTTDLHWYIRELSRKLLVLTNSVPQKEIARR